MKGINLHFLPRGSDFPLAMFAQNGAGEAKSGSRHAEDINAFPSESDSWSRPLPAEQTTTPRGFVVFFFLFRSSADSCNSDPATKSRGQLNQRWEDVFQDRSFFSESRRERDGKKGGGKKKQNKNKRGKERKDS